MVHGQEKKEFLELKQEKKSISEYEREFVQLIQYTHENVLIEREMCIRFKDSLNDKIRMLVEVMEI